MDLLELRREQQKLAPKIVLQDISTGVRTLGGATVVSTSDGKLIACVVVCDFPSMSVKEQKTYTLSDPLPHQLGYEAYREMPAIIEAYNQLEEEPDVLLVKGAGILHPRGIGVASHVGLALNKPAIGVAEKLPLGRVENGRIFVGSSLCGFELKTREFSKPVYVSPGHLISLGSALRIVTESIQYPHKLPEPLHVAHKIARKKAQGNEASRSSPDSEGA